MSGRRYEAGGVVFRKVILTGAALVGITAISFPEALAGSNDVTPQRFGQCVNDDAPPCAGVRLDEAGFRAFAQELGVATASYAMQPAETLGLNGFGFSINYASTSLSSDESYWQLGNANGDPQDAMPLLSLQMRKGLPFSLEVGATVGLVPNSEITVLGGEVKYALHEDTLRPVPDLAIRAWGNAMVGHRDLSLYNVGLDVIASVPIGIGGSVQLTPIIGYSFQAIFAKTGLIDATPGDPMPPLIGGSGYSNAPEFVFELDHAIVHRMFAGLRLSIAVVDLNFQASFLGGQTTIAGGLGLSF